MRIVQYIISSKLNNLYKFCHFCLGLNKSVRCLFASFILIRLNFRYCELRVIFVTACRANIHQLVDVYCIVYVKWLCDCDSPSYVSLNGTAVSFACVRLGVDQKFWVGFFFPIQFLMSQTIEIYIRYFIIEYYTSDGRFMATHFAKILIAILRSFSSHAVI